MKHNILSLIASLLCTLSIVAQDNVIDEIIWVVGDEAILKSEVEEERMRAQYEGQSIPGDPYCFLPEQMAVQKLYLHQAELDSIYANEGTVKFQVDYRMNYIESQIGSKEKMEEYFRKPMAEIREEMATSIRNMMIVQQMQQKLVEHIKGTPAEIQRYYNSLPQDSLPMIPAQVEVQIVSFEPQVPIEEINRIKTRLREFTERVNSGDADFSMLARLYSEDTESARRGGELGFMGKGQLVPPFADALFSMTVPGKVSRIIETEYGYHIIQLIERKGERANCRHILLRPRVSTADKEKAILVLDSLSNLIRKDSMSFEEAVARYSQDKNTAMNAGLMNNEQAGSTKFEYQQLPSEIAKQIYSMQIGDISKPFVMIDETKNKEIVAIVKLKNRTDSHRANLVDDYQVIKDMYEAHESNLFLQKWIAKKQSETYIWIEPHWQGCDFQYPGWLKKK